MEDTQPAPLKVLIADDHPLILAGLRRVLERSDGIEVVGEAESADQLLQLVDRRRPDLVLMDLRMPGASGTNCIEQIKAIRPEIKVVVLSACEENATINGALTAGASAYVLKTLSTVDINSVIRQVSSGCVFHATSLGHASSSTVHLEERPTLTDREHAILEAVATGQTTAAISRNLWVSEHTVKFHLTNIYRKLGVTNRAGAVRYALEHDLAAA
jgi:DNA-binding NarL/FixJ family response regulator